MAGSSTLDEDVLVDSLVPTVDSLRGDLHAAFGVRHFRVFVVSRTWSGGLPGLGTFTDVEEEILPRPMVEPFTELKYKLEPCGLTEAGYVKLSEISLAYSEPDLVGESEEDTQILWRISEGQGQNTATRYFFPKGPPYPDRIKTIGWLIGLMRVQESTPDSDLERAPSPTTPGRTW